MCSYHGQEDCGRDISTNILSLTISLNTISRNHVVSWRKHGRLKALPGPQPSPIFFSILLAWNRIVPGNPEAILVLQKDVNLLITGKQRRQNK